MFSSIRKRLVTPKVNAVGGSELHEPRRALRGNHVRMPGRFDVDYGLHEFQGDAVRPRVVIGPAHLDIEQRGRRTSPNRRAERHGRHSIAARIEAPSSRSDSHQVRGVES